MDYTPQSEKLQSRNFKNFGFDFNVTVSIISFIFVLGFIVFVLIFKETSAEFFNNIKLGMTKHFNWWFVIALNITFVFSLVLLGSKVGTIKIGGKNAEKAFGNFAWYAMLFSAGIGIGIFFYGIAEPIYHLNIPNALQSHDVFDPLKVMYLHWGFHAWAVYSVFAVAIGYFAYNKGLPVSMRSLFYPFLKDKIFGLWGDVIDSIAVLSVLFGLSTSLGLGARQINSGLHYVTGLPFGPTTQLIIIIVITFVATLSVVSGISKGIKFLSELNVRLSFVLLLIIFLIGPSLYILEMFFGSFFIYLKEFIPMGLFVAENQSDVSWQSGWTIFYWAWWFSWSPFVGMFIARISKGRTIREITFGTMFLPAIVCFFTMTILGATGLLINTTHEGVLETAIQNDLSTTLFVMIDHLSFSRIMSLGISLVAVVAVTLFFVTSSDSGSLVVDFLTSGGNIHTPKRQRVFWACMEGVIAASVLILGGVNALTTLQAVVIIMGLPFSVLFILMIVGLYRNLRKEKEVQKQEYLLETS